MKRLIVILLLLSSLSIGSVETYSVDKSKMVVGVNYFPKTEIKTEISTNRNVKVGESSTAMTVVHFIFSTVVGLGSAAALILLARRYG